jgi:hypothetical protein
MPKQGKTIGMHQRSKLLPQLTLNKAESGPSYFFVSPCFLPSSNTHFTIQTPAGTIFIISF